MNKNFKKQKIKKNCFLALILLILFLIPYQGIIAQNKLSLTFSNITLGEAIKKIEAASKYTFFYDTQKTDLKQKVSVDAVNQPLETILSSMLSASDLKFEVDNNQIVLLPKDKNSDTDPINQKEKKISGVIVDETGTPVIGASVQVKGTTRGTVTGADGDFSMQVNPGDVLMVSYLGFRNQEIPYSGQNGNMNVMLQEDSKLLDEVVVTALGIKREEKGLGYAVQNVNAKELTTVKTVDVSSKLTGKVAGLNVRNSTEFNEAPTLLLRGETPLLVIDGIPYQNMTMRDVASDDIETISVLKGATASALYGERGKSGAIMITTKRGGKENKLSVEVNSSAMFTAGYLAMPEVQTSYSSGSGGKYATGDYVWGDKLDIGRTAVQYNPYTYQWEETPLTSKGKNNLKNFQQLSYVLNNNINISQQGENGGFRASVTHVYNQGQYPNTELNKFTAAISGNMKHGSFDMEAGLTYNKRSYPSDLGMGYGGTGFLYNLVVWQGTEFDIRDYKNYWVAGKENYQQNWMDKSWYNNPWFLANEARNSGDYDITNGFITANYQILPWLKATFRSGLDAYSQKNEEIRPISTVGSVKGSYNQSMKRGYSINNDLLFLVNHKFGNLGVDGFLGGTIFYLQSDEMKYATQNGLTVPGFYSIYASVDPVSATQGGQKKQVNSAYAKATLSWKSLFFLDVTGRNDWSSTLKSDQRSYFYPSVAGSWVVSETFSLPREISLLKLRGSWTVTKEAAGIYDINSPFGISTNIWNGMNSAYFPASISINGTTYNNIIRDANILPQSSRTIEFGLGSNFFTNRLRFDIAYYNKLYYNRITTADVSDASGFSYMYVNFKEDIVRKGVEITLGGTPVQTADWKWDINANWSLDRRYYASVDPNYSQDRPWVKKGARYDYISLYNWEQSPNGQMIHSGGKPVASKYESLFGYSDPDWVWGITNSVQWKQFTLGCSFDGRVGGMMFNTTNQAMWNSGSHIESDNQYRYDQVVNGLKNYIGSGVKIVSGDVERDVYGNITKDTRVFAPNDVPVTYESYMVSMNPYIGTKRSQNYFESTFIKLRELSLSYELPRNLEHKIGLKNLTVSFIAQNLWMWTKEFKYSDPDKAEENMNAPSIRYIGGNIKFNF